MSGLTIEVDRDLRLGEEHQPRAMLKTMPPPRSRRTSNRGLPERKSPRSMNGAGPSVTRSVRVVTRRSASESFNVERHRRNKLALMPSRRQNSGTDSPLLDYREKSCFHTAAPRRIRLLCAIDLSSC